MTKPRPAGRTSGRNKLEKGISVATQDHDSRCNRFCGEQPTAADYDWIPAPLFVSDNGRLIYANNLLTELTGVPPEELRGMVLSDLIGDGTDDCRATPRAPRTGITTNSGHRSVRIARRDGRTRNAWLTCAPGCATHRTRIVGILTESHPDIGPDRDARLLMEHLDTIADLSSDYAYVFSVDPEGILSVEWVTGSVYKLLGYTEEDLKGPDSVLKQIHPDDLPSFAESRARLMTGETVSGDIRLMTKAGDIRWVRYTTRPVRGGDENRVCRIYGSAQDITNEMLATESRRMSEEFFRLLIENASDLLTAIDRDGTILYASSSVQNILGYPAEEIVGTNVMRIIHAHDRYRALESISMGFRQPGVVTNLEIRLRTKHGKVRVFESIGKSFIDGTGREVGFITSRDITERKVAERRLFLSEDKYRRFFEEDLTADYICNIDGRLLACNPAFVRMFNFRSLEEAMSTNVCRLYKFPGMRQSIITEVSRTSKLEYKDLELVTMDGRTVHAVANIIGIFDRVGTLTQLKGYLFDDTRRRQAEDQLIQAQKMESLSTLAGGIAHDFNNILSIILGHCGLIKRGGFDGSKIHQGMASIEKATLRGASLVRQLLTFGRQSPTVYVSLRLRDIVMEVVKLLENTLPKSIEVEVELNETVPSILGDPTQMHQVLLNLSVNARDAMPAGGFLRFFLRTVPGSELRRKYSSATAECYVGLDIGDTGMGMDQGTMTKIFEPFFTTKASGKGTGLGLSVAFGIVQHHNGIIDVESSIGRGTVFHLYFPAQECELKAGELKESDVGDAPGGSETILLVDDEVMLLELASAFLREKGYEVLIARDGPEAMQMFSRTSPRIGLVLTDLGLPGMDGLELTKNLLRMDRAARVIVASGYLDTDLRDRALRAGARGAFQKPFAWRELLQKIRDVLDEAPSGENR